jgi:hypothetical protein
LAKVAFGFVFRKPGLAKQGFGIHNDCTIGVDGEVHVRLIEKVIKNPPLCTPLLEDNVRCSPTATIRV